MICNFTQAAILTSAIFFVGTASAAGFPAIPHPVDGYVISQEKKRLPDVPPKSRLR